MTEFLQRFKQNGNYSLQGMRETAKSLLPYDKSLLDDLHEGLKRGNNVLEDEDLLNMYLYSFGKMHKFKLLKAFISLLEQVDFNKKEIEIYDWGCGQGIATVCLLDCFKYCEVLPEIKCINLIDLSFGATSRASDVIECCYPNCIINIITKNIDDLSIKDFVYSDVIKIHLFSNILDIESYDIFQFSKLFLDVFSGDNYIVCVGPCYNRERLDEFVDFIEPDSFFDIIDKERGQWLNDWSLSVRTFFKKVLFKSPFSPIIINYENFPKLELNLSSIKEAEDSEGNLFYYYWVTMNYCNKKIVCCTGSTFTKLLGKNADTAKAIKTVIKYNGKFQIKQAFEENGRPIFVNNDFERPLLVIRPISM